MAVILERFLKDSLPAIIGILLDPFSCIASDGRRACVRRPVELVTSSQFNHRFRAVVAGHEIRMLAPNRGKALGPAKRA
jgi:hypothetical protein